MKRHPFLLGFLIVGLVLAIFYGLALLTASMFSDSGSSGSSILPGEAIGVVEVKGMILDTSDQVDRLIDLRENDNVKAIVLRVDSPGGGVAPAQELYREIQRTQETKPVVASMGSLAASGGYYVSCPAQVVFANPGTLTGSIGVIMEFLNMEGLLQWMGLKTNVIKSGEFKDIGNSAREMTPAEEALLQELIDDVYDQFVAAVAESREMDVEAVKALADGRIFSGRQALEAGLVDELGGLRDAIAKAAELGGIEGEPRILYPRKRRPGVFDLFFEEMFGALRNAALTGERPVGLRYQ